MHTLIHWLESFGFGTGLMLGRLAIVSAVALWLARSSFAQRRRVYVREIPPVRIRREFLSALGLCFLDAAVFVPVHTTE